jgi:hypothetical protein
MDAREKNNSFSFVRPVSNCSGLRLFDEISTEKNKQIRNKAEEAENPQSKSRHNIKFY